jgi:Protein of unknown function (DUF3102)
METISTQRQATLQKKSQIKDLLKEAIDHHGHCEAARASALSTQRLALWHAWQVGIRLNKMKSLIRRGDWLDWLDLHFCKPLKVSVRTAQVYMKIDTDNIDLRDDAKTQRVAPIEADFQLLMKLKADTIRKYAFGFIPKKDEPNKHLNIRLPRPYSFDNIINEYNRVRNRHVSGLQVVDFEEIREDTAEFYQFMQWLHGDSPNNPWDSAICYDWRNRTARRKAEPVVEIDLEHLLESQH